jgi:hypothetical protein
MLLVVQCRDGVLEDLVTSRFATTRWANQHDTESHVERVEKLQALKFKVWLHFQIQGIT